MAWDRGRGHWTVQHRIVNIIDKNSMWRTDETDNSKEEEEEEEEEEESDSG